MTAPVFILPTSGPRTYRGKYPLRFRSQSHGATGLHVELNDGTRLWSARAHLAPTSANPDCSALLARAVAMTAEQYETLKAAAELLRGRAGIAGHGKREQLETRVRELVASIQPDDRQYAKRNAEAARREILAGETGRGFDPARPFRVRNKTPQFSGSFDFATLAEARDYLAGQLARRDSVVSGAAPVGPDSNSQCPMSSFIVWAEGTETLGDMGWTPPAPGSARWIAPATVETAPEAPEAAPSPVRLNLARQRDDMAAIADAENPATVAVKAIRTIDCTPTWRAILPMLRAAVENGTPEGRRIAWEELARMADAADLWNASNKA